MKKKIVIASAAIVGMSGFLGMLDFLLDTFESSGWFARAIRFLALIGWGYITYNLVTLKYKWIKKLAE